jgi:pimeloyl-ACP methyl ester carboxylesterase
MATRTISGSRLELFDEGSGEPLVLVHGSASDYRTWHAQRPVLAERFRVISYSRRYHWPNEPIPEGGVYRMMEHVDDLAELLRAVDAAPAHLVGHSYGGFLCLLLAIREPGLVRTLVLAEPPVVTLFVSDPPKPAELLKVLFTRPRTAAAIVKFGARGVEPARKAFRRGETDKGVEIFGDAVFGRGGFASLPEARRRQVLDNVTNVRAEVLGPAFAPLAAEEVRGVDIPTLLLTGERSISLFHRLADRVEELIPRVERAEVPGGSHMMHEDNPPAFNDAVLSFFGGHGATT